MLFVLTSFSEAPVGIEPTVGDLQSPALPLGDGAGPGQAAAERSNLSRALRVR